MSYTLYRPETVAEAIAIRQKTGGVYLAGGTVSLVTYHKRGQINESQISLDRLSTLHGIALSENSLFIGSMTTMDDIEQSREIREYAHALWQAAIEIGGPQIRNRATLGGNIAAASPSSDCAVPLLAMNAVVCASGIEGERRIPIRAFFLGRLTHALQADELITGIEVPLRRGSVSAFRKVGKRNALAVSCINMAIVRCKDETAVAVGAAAPKPVFCAETSAILSGAEKDMAAALEKIQTEISPIDDRWATASYRRTVCGNLLRALMEETEGQS